MDTPTMIIQVTQAAHSYTEQLLGIAKQHQVDTTKAESLISLGDPLLSKAQSEVSTNATLAIKDAMGAMRYYRGAAEYVQYALAGPSDHRTDDRKADQLAYLRKEVQHAEAACETPAGGRQDELLRNPAAIPAATHAGAVPSRRCGSGLPVRRLRHWNARRTSGDAANAAGCSRNQGRGLCPIHSERN